MAVRSMSDKELARLEVLRDLDSQRLTAAAAASSWASVDDRRSHSPAFRRIGRLRRIQIQVPLRQGPVGRQGRSRSVRVGLRRSRAP